MAKNNASYHLSKRASDGKWQVFRAGSDKVIKLFDTKAEAEEYTRKMAENQGVAVLSHASKGKNKGKIQKTYFCVISYKKAIYSLFCYL